jgi:hypothetical protein
MKQFWHSDIIEKSFQTLLELNREFDFILIGGWAVYFWSKKMKSKDIDIVVDFSELGKIKEKYKLVKNSRLRKYEIKFEEFDIDIYLPHYSKIGFPLEKLGDYVQNIEGFKVPKVEVLFLMKLFVFNQRRNSIKGEKDKADIISLLDIVEINWREFKKLAQKHNPLLLNVLKDMLQNTLKVPELRISVQKMSKLRKKILKEL